MKKILILFFVIGTITACTNEKRDDEKSKIDSVEKAGGILYTCPMHPEVVEISRGICPKCGMDLVEVSN